MDDRTLYALRQLGRSSESLPLVELGARGHRPDLPRMRVRSSSKPSSRDGNGAEVARRHGISWNTHDNHLEAALRSLRHR